jgi:hypothetical protein
MFQLHEIKRGAFNKRFNLHRLTEGAENQPHVKVADPTLMRDGGEEWRKERIRAVGDEGAEG